MVRRSGLLGCIAHVFVLSSLIIAQPLFDLLSRHAAFLAAHKAGVLEVLGLVSVLCVFIPAGLVGIELVGRSFGSRVQQYVHLVLVAVFGAVWSLSALKSVEAVSGIFLVAVAIGLGVGSATCYARFVPVRMFWTVLTPVVFLLPGLFLFRAPISQFVFDTTEQRSARATIRNPAPIILVVFDEFPLVSLLEANGDIDAVRYPNFAALAEDATWFRNASTVSTSTMHSVPAILSGVHPNPEWLPTPVDYPNTLFTLLRGNHQIQAFESTTALCPETVCGQWETAPHRFYSLLRDVAFVYLHIILPEDLTHSLPVVTQTWKGFGKEEARPGATWDDWKNRGEHFTELTALFSQTDKPLFAFLHPLLPHVPWEYFPTGRKYKSSGLSTPGLDIKKEMWGENEDLVIQGYRRHLLQVGFVDTLLGNLLKQLRTQGLYDQSLIVITADHGASFWTKTSRRSAAGPYPGDVTRVPLFMKVPYQRMGYRSDRPVRTIDILPTITDILGIELPWPVDGSSLNSLTAMCSHGRVMPVVPGAVPGYVDQGDLAEGQTTIFGWAADIRRSEVAKRIFIFANGELIYDAPTNTERPDVAQAFNDTGIQRAGFHYTFPEAGLTPTDDVRVFAVSHQDVASELRYPKRSLGIWQQKRPQALPTFDSFENLEQSCSEIRSGDLPRTTFLAQVQGLAGDGPDTLIKKISAAAFTAPLLSLQDSLERKLALFGAGKEPPFLPSRPYRNLIGQAAPQTPAGEKNAFHVALDYDPSILDIRPDSRFIPALIMGEVVGEVATAAALNVAVAVNGTIQGVMPCYLDKGRLRFSIFVPEAAFQTGPNELTFFLVSGEESAPQFSRVNVIWRSAG